MEGVRLAAVNRLLSYAVHGKDPLPWHLEAVYGCMFPVFPDTWFLLTADRGWAEMSRTKPGEKTTRDWSTYMSL